MLSGFRRVHSDKDYRVNGGYSRALLLIRLLGSGVQLGPLVTAATDWPIVPAPDDDGEFGGMKIVKGNRSTQRKPAPAPLFPPQIPLDQTQDRTRAAVVGIQRLTAWAMARPLAEP
jgi:hypothetical protein